MEIEHPERRGENRGASRAPECDDERVDGATGQEGEQDVRQAVAQRIEPEHPLVQRKTDRHDRPVERRFAVKKRDQVSPVPDAALANPDEVVIDESVTRRRAVHDRKDHERHHAGCAHQKTLGAHRHVRDSPTNASQMIASIEKTGIDLNRAQKLLAGFWKLVLRHQRLAQQIVGGGTGRSERQRPLGGRCGARRVTRPDQHTREILVCTGVAGLEFSRAAERRHGLRRPTGGGQRDAETAKHLRVSWHDLQIGAIVIDRRGVLLLVQQQLAQQGVRLRIGHVSRRRQREFISRVLLAVLVEANPAKDGMRCARREHAGSA
jgi:hypothetical protein